MVCTVSTLQDPFLRYAIPPPYCRGLTDDNPKDALRLVGYVEYQSALEDFDSLLKLASKEDLAAMNAIVSERPEYMVTLFGGKLQQPVFVSPSWKDLSGQKQKGLGWIIGLARVELATMLSAFVHVNQSFVVVNPNKYDYEAYRILVLDGLRHHMQLIEDQGIAEALLDPQVTPRVLAILRRVELAEDLHRATVQLYAADLNPEQVRDLKRLAERLAAAKNQLLVNLGKRLR